VLRSVNKQKRAQCFALQFLMPSIGDAIAKCRVEPLEKSLKQSGKGTGKKLCSGHQKHDVFLQPSTFYLYMYYK